MCCCSPFRISRTDRRAEGDMVRDVSSTICPLVSQENRRDLDHVRCVVHHENDAIAAYSFPVSPSPASPLEGNHISAKWILTHLAETLMDECLVILREPSKLSCGVSCEPDGPCHVLNFQALRIPHRAAGLRLCVQWLPLPVSTHPPYPPASWA